MITRIAFVIWLVWVIIFFPLIISAITPFQMTAAGKDIGIHWFEGFMSLLTLFGVAGIVFTIGGLVLMMFTFMVIEFSKLIAMLFRWIKYGNLNP